MIFMNSAVINWSKIQYRVSFADASGGGGVGTPATWDCKSFRDALYIYAWLFQLVSEHQMAKQFSLNLYSSASSGLAAHIFSAEPWQECFNLDYCTDIPSPTKYRNFPNIHICNVK